MDLHIVLQPIVDITNGDVIAHEALLRGPAGSPLESPARLFEEAERKGERRQLETQARRLAVSRLTDLPHHQRLFINVDARYPDIPAMPDHPAEHAARVTVEISERYPVMDNPLLINQVKRWRAMGHQIALDDYGAGYMGMGAVIALDPDLIKLDRVVIAEIDHDHRRRIMVSAMVNMARDLGIAVVAEGVETAGECAAIQEAGITLAQGYYLQRPDDIPTTHIPACRTRLIDRDRTY